MSNKRSYVVEGQYSNYMNKSKKIVRKETFTDFPTVDMYMFMNDDSSDDIDEGIGIWNE